MTAASAAVFKRVMRTHKLAPKLVPVFVTAPELEDSCERLADFLGDQFTGNSSPLIFEMLDCALQAFRAARKGGEPSIAFAQGLFEHAHLVYARRYVARRGDALKVWYPMDEPITSFESRHAGHKLEMINEPCLEKITKRTAALQLASRVLRGEIFRLYFEDYDVAHYDAH
jgi:hypothetical protein